MTAVPHRVSVCRGEIWLVDPDPTIGSEIRKIRPCVVISPPEMHDYLRTAIIAPMTTGSHPAPFRIAAHFAGKDGLILLDQLRTVDKTRLIQRSGVLDGKTLNRVLDTLLEVFSK